MFDGHGSERPPSTCSRLPQGAHDYSIGTDVHLGNVGSNQIDLQSQGVVDTSLEGMPCYGNQTKTSFNPKSFLAKIGEGRSFGNYRKDQIVFSQGDPADAVFFIHKGKVKVTVVSEQGKEAVVAILGANDFFGEACLAGQARRIATVAAMTELRRREIGGSSNHSADPNRAGVFRDVHCPPLGSGHFMNKFRQLGFIDYNGGIAVHSSLLNAVLHDQPQIKI